MTRIPTPDVDVVRRAYAALAAGDTDQLEQCFAHDAVWHEPGSNIYSGDLVGWPKIRDEFLALLGPLSHSTLRTELVDVDVSERYVVAVHRATGKHNGVTLDSTSYEVVLVVRGRVQEVWAFHAKQAEVDAFWTCEPTAHPEAVTNTHPSNPAAGPPSVADFGAGTDRFTVELASR